MRNNQCSQRINFKTEIVNKLHLKREKESKRMQKMFKLAETCKFENFLRIHYVNYVFYVYFWIVLKSVITCYIQSVT